jgi:hypothetical protein
MRKLWKWLLSVSGALAVVLLLLGQARETFEWADRAWRFGQGWVAQGLLSIPPLQRRAAEAAVAGYHQNEVCVGEVGLVDLDRDGRRTDLLVRYVDPNLIAQEDPEASCADYQSGSFWTQRDRFLAARSEGFGFRPLDSLSGYNGIEPVGSLLVATYGMTDFPTSTVYGYQHGRLEELRQFQHMLDFGSEDDAEIEVFDILATAAGADFRTAEGLFRIAWDEAAQGYVVSELDWTDIAHDGQLVLHVERGGEASEPALLLDDRVIYAKSANEGERASFYVETLDRIVFDPNCQPDAGLKPVPDSLGAVELDPAAERHAFWCILAPDNTVEVEVTTD